MVWKFCGKAQFPHSFHTMKLDEITVFYAVYSAYQQPTLLFIYLFLFIYLLYLTLVYLNKQVHQIWWIIFVSIVILFSICTEED